MYQSDQSSFPIRSKIREEQHQQQTQHYQPSQQYHRPHPLGTGHLAPVQVDGDESSECFQMPETLPFHQHRDSDQVLPATFNMRRGSHNQTHNSSHQHHNQRQHQGHLQNYNAQSQVRNHQLIGHSNQHQLQHANIHSVQSSHQYQQQQHQPQIIMDSGCGSGTKFARSPGESHHNNIHVVQQQQQQQVANAFKIEEVGSHGNQLRQHNHHHNHHQDHLLQPTVNNELYAHSLDPSISNSGSPVSTTSSPSTSSSYSTIGGSSGHLMTMAKDPLSCPVIVAPGQIHHPQATITFQNNNNSINTNNNNNNNLGIHHNHQGSNVKPHRSHQFIDSVENSNEGLHQNLNHTHQNRVPFHQHDHEPRGKPHIVTGCPSGGGVLSNQRRINVNAFESHHSEDTYELSNTNIAPVLHSTLR